MGVVTRRVRRSRGRRGAVTCAAAVCRPVRTSSISPPWEADDGIEDRRAASPRARSPRSPDPNYPTTPTFDRRMRSTPQCADFVEFGVAAGRGPRGRRTRPHRRCAGRASSAWCCWWYLAFLVVYFVLVRDRSDAEAAIDRIVTVLIWSVGFARGRVLVWMIVFLVVKGLQRLSWSFFTEDMSKVGPLDSGGGAKHAIIGTLEQVGIATVVVVPVAVLTAVYLHEIKGRLAQPGALHHRRDERAAEHRRRPARLHASGSTGHGFSGVAGAAALAVLMLPTVTRHREEILRTIPDTLARRRAGARRAAVARRSLKVVLPTALAGLVTAAILGVARAVGETAPMLLTAFGSDSTNTQPVVGRRSPTCRCSSGS